MKDNCVTTVYSRVTGYFQPTSQWNKGKVEEFKDRKLYDIKEKQDVQLLRTSSRG